MFRFLISDTQTLNGNIMGKMSLLVQEKHFFRELSEIP